MNRNLCLFSSLILVAGAAPAAEQPRFGFQAALAQPMADLPDTASLGLQAGCHLQWDFSQGHGLMARADATSYGSHDGFSRTSLGLGADYTYHLERRQHGVYVLGGLSLLSYHLSFPDADRTNSSLGLSLGAGYDLNRNLGFQVRYTTHSADGESLGSMNFGVTYTF
jgi:hypothetical protein